MCSGYRVKIDDATALIGRVALMVAAGAALATCATLAFGAAGFVLGFGVAVASRAAALGHDLARMVM